MADTTIPGPSTARVRAAYVRGMSGRSALNRALFGAEFDRWLDAVREGRA